MKNLGLAAFVGMLLATMAFGQQAQSRKTQVTAAKRTISISGRASDDGTIVLRNSDGKVWKITNPDILQDYEGLLVVVRAQINPDRTNEVRVLSVKAGREVEYLTRWDDSAFRR